MKKKFHKLKFSKFQITLSVAGLLSLSSNSVFAQLAGCPSSVLSSGNQSITCSTSTGTNPTAINTPINTSANTYDTISVTINPGTTVQLSGSPIGLASKSLVVNNGNLDSNSFYYGYGISFGANGRSQTGGNSVTNNGNITTRGGNADGIMVSSTNSSSLSNSITNNGNINTSGSSSNGITLKSGTTSSTQVNTIQNTGTISVNGSLGSIGIYIQQGQANVTNKGSINAGSGTAINFNSHSTNGLSNSLTLDQSSVTIGSINFNATNLQETLNFNGLRNNSFDNTITGLKIINVTANAEVNMNNPSGYSLFNGLINVDNTSKLTFSSPIIDSSISAISSITKEGSGTLILSGTNTYTGPTNINAGNLILSGSITSETTVNSGGTLLGSGSITGNLINAGNVIPSASGNITNLTINGNYIGQNGIYSTNIYPPNTSPTADTLTITGTASGNTSIKVIDKGGLGNLTTGNGILVVAAGNNASSTTFNLNGRVASGAYEYKLYKGDSAGNGNNWYLSTNEQVIPPIPVTPDARERIEVAVYPATPTLARMYINTTVDTLAQRRGDLSLLDLNQGEQTTRDWARVIGNNGKLSPESINDGPKMNFNSFALQFGTDLYRNQTSDGDRTYFGPYATIGNSTSSTSNTAGSIQTGNTRLDAYTLGLNATHFLNNGIYFDGLIQGTRFTNVSASSTQNANINTTGWGFAGSFETGAQIPVAGQVSITPQAQVVFTSNTLASTADAYGQINFQQDNATKIRLGLMLSGKATEEDKLGSFWLRTSIWESFNSGTSTTFQSLYGVNPITFNSTIGGRWLSVDGGFNARLSKSSYAFLNASLETSINNPTYQTVSGRFGIQTRF